MGEVGGECMSTYKQNLISLLPYGRSSKFYKAKRDGKGHIVVSFKSGKKWRKFRFDETTGVIL